MNFEPALGKGSEKRAKSYENAFNLTMSYRRDSDVFVPYGHFVKKTGIEKAQSNLYPNWAYTKSALSNEILPYTHSIPDPSIFKYVESCFTYACDVVKKKCQN